MQYQKIIISRTDGIGDVILALPMAGLLKELFPECEIIFLAKSYTKAVVETCKHIDLFVAWDELEKLGEERAAEELNKLQADVIIHVFPRKSIAEIAKKAQNVHRTAFARAAVMPVPVRTFLLRAIRAHSEWRWW